MDHIKYAKDFAENGIDIYASKGTLNALKLQGHRYKGIKALQQFNIGNFTILPFDTEHDAIEPLGFLIQYNPTKERLLYATDTYYIKYKFKELNYIMIECNYIKGIARKNMKEGTINKSRYTRLLESHMSLENLLAFLKSNDLRHVQKIILCHLSDTNSNAETMKNEVFKMTGIETIIADKNLITELKKYPF